jgi:hypothetical protein
LLSQLHPAKKSVAVFFCINHRARRLDCTTMRREER